MLREFLASIGIRLMTKQDDAIDQGKSDQLLKEAKSKEEEENHIQNYKMLSIKTMETQNREQIISCFRNWLEP